MTAVSVWYLSWILFTTIVFWLIPEKYRHHWLTFATIILLGIISPTSLALFCVLSAATIFTICRKEHRKTAYVIAATTFCLLVTKVGQQLLQHNDLAYPLMFGISFYTLRIIHLLIEDYLDKLQFDSVQQLQSYLFFPPIIAAGPIQRFDTFTQLGGGKFSSQLCAKGLERILHGCAMIIVIHNVLFKKLFIPWIENLSSAAQWHPTVIEWFSCFEYGISLYLQFSAYSSIAIGFALLLGYHLDENFNWPFLRPSLVKFWRNWHISLSSFCRTYIFTGTLAFSRSVPAAFIASMLAIGLWHSVTPNFFLWGVYHGVGLIITQTWLSSKAFDTLSGTIPFPLISLAGWAFTFNYVILGFAFTKHENMTETLLSLGRIFGFS